MKSDLSTAAFLLFFILLFGFGMNSCSGEVDADRFQYTKLDFDAQIHGAIDGQEIEARLQSRPAAEDGECVLLLSFQAPSPLSGLTVSRSASGIAEVRLGELVLREIDVDGFLEPFLPLICPGDISSVKRDENGNTVVSVCDENCDITYVFSADGEMPSRIYGQYKGKMLDLFIEEYKG